MRNNRAHSILLRLVAICCAVAAPICLAQIPQTSRAGQVERVFASTSSAAAQYSNPSGQFQRLESVKVALQSDSVLVIHFSAQGSVAPTTGPVPVVFIRCEIDGAPCEPNHNPLTFFYPQYCCDVRSFTWVVHKARRGSHSVDILWGMGNATSATITNRTLVVEAAKL